MSKEYSRAPRKQITLGIDPGTRRIGYGVVAGRGSSLEFLDGGLIKVVSRDDVGALQEIRRGVGALVARWHPTVVGIERLFFAKNQKTAMGVAQARGVILVACGELGIPIAEYAPSEVKLSLTGDGAADKRAVGKMVRLVLRQPDLNLIDDAMDAIGIAIVASGDHSTVPRTRLDRRSG